MANAVTSRTFCNRYTKCYYYDEKDTYIKYIDIFFNKLILEYRSYQGHFLELFANRFSSAAYTGIKFIYKNDREVYKKLCIDCAINLDKFFDKFTIINCGDEVVYKDKIKCFIGGTIDKKNINIFFSFRTLDEMQKDLDFYLLNNYIYNQMRDFDNACLIFNVPSNTYFLIQKNDSDYTTLMRKGFMKSVISSRIKRQGEYCITCKLQCKPTFINKLERLTAII